MSRILPVIVAVAVVVAIGFAALLGTQPSAAHPAAAGGLITPLFPGKLTGTASTTPGPPDGLFATLAGSAASSIDVALYDFNRVSVRDALLAAHGRGVNVRVVGDGEDAVDPGYAPFYNSLVSAGITVITDTKTSLMHNKFAVFDGQVTWTGSANFTDTGFTFNAENIVVITDTVVANIYGTEFNEMFSGKFSNDKIDNTGHNTVVGGSALEIAFAPTDGVQDRIAAALNSANSSIQVAMFTFTNDALGNALIAAHNRGVQVEVLLDQVAAGSAGGERDRLCGAGVAVRVENFAAKIHDKVAVVDAGTSSDPLVVTGSTNWTANAVQANDENLLIVHDAGLAADFAAELTRVRAASGPNGFCNAPQLTATPTGTPPSGNAPPCTLAGITCIYLPIVERAAAALPDLAIAGMSISLDTDCLSDTSQMGLRVAVANLGSGDAGPFVVEANGVQQNVAGLGSGQSVSLWFAGYKFGEPNSAIADVSELLAESDETNNQRSEMLPVPTPPLPCPTPSATPTGTPPAGPAKITAILYDPADSLAEYVEIENTSAAALDMSGWTLRDLAGTTYTLPNFTLAAGAKVRVWTNSGTNDAANLYWGRTQAVWNNTGDTAFLRDTQGRLISQYVY
jgi:phosphatidylserine/phosphatidylglycerophosphate/cardiolipin synthase-like enzyme